VRVLRRRPKGGGADVVEMTIGVAVTARQRGKAKVIRFIPLSFAKLILLLTLKMDQFLGEN